MNITISYSLSCGSVFLYIIVLIVEKMMSALVVDIGWLWNNKWFEHGVIHYKSNASKSTFAKLSFSSLLRYGLRHSQRKLYQSLLTNLK